MRIVRELRGKAMLETFVLHSKTGLSA